MQKNQKSLLLIPALLGIIIVSSSSALAATDLWSPHIAAGDWHTTLALYNSSSHAISFQLEKFTSSGMTVEPAKQFSSPAQRWFLLSSDELSYDGSAHLSSTGDLLVKISYQYMNSHSLCEFYLSDSVATEWIMPNTVRNWLSWTGVGLINPTDFPLQVSLKAWSQGTQVGSRTEILSPRQKLAQVSQEIWDGMQYQDFDTISISSDQPIPAPIGIMGNEANDRHVFFTAQMQPGVARTLHVWAVHIATGDWKTSMSLFNSSSDAIDFELEKYGADGSALGEPLDFTAPPNQWFPVPASTLDFDGAAHLISNKKLLIKLSYQYKDSPSV